MKVMKGGFFDQMNVVSAKKTKVAIYAHEKFLLKIQGSCLRLK